MKWSVWSEMTFVRDFAVSVLLLLGAASLFGAWSFFHTALTKGPPPLGCGLWTREQRSAGFFIAFCLLVVVVIASGWVAVIISGGPS